MASIWEWLAMVFGGADVPHEWTCGEEPGPVPEKVWPMPLLKDGRKPRITSRYGPNNPGRPRHRGVDMLYRYLPSDPRVKVGDGGAVVKDGKRRWWVPTGTLAVATQSGHVLDVDLIDTGHRVWLYHPGDPDRYTGYMHLSAPLVRDGDQVQAGQPLGLVWHNPQDHDPVHLHFEVLTGWPRSGETLMDPEQYLIDAEWAHERT